MQLREFITETLSEIFAGVAGAKSAAHSYGGVINPWPMLDDNALAKTLIDRESMAPICAVDFDVALIVTDQTSTTAGGGAKIMVLDAGIKRESESTRSSEHRVRFSIPLVLPRP